MFPISASQNLFLCLSPHVSRYTYLLFWSSFQHTLSYCAEQRFENYVPSKTVPRKAQNYLHTHADIYASMLGIIFLFSDKKSIYFYITDFYGIEPQILYSATIHDWYLTLRLLMSYIYMERIFLMFLDHTQRRSTVGRTPLDE